MNTQKLKVEGMTCGGCANRVAKALNEVPGVADVRVHLAEGIAEIDSEAPVDAALLAGAVEKKGYKAAAVA